MKSIEGKDGHFIRWNWPSSNGHCETIVGNYPLSVAQHFGNSRDALQLIPARGAIFGIVVDGIVRLRLDYMLHELDRGHYFVVDKDQGAILETFDSSKVLLICSCGSSFPIQLGGPIEMIGRLRYIDGCTDTVLIHPWKKGQACLNHLHFPPDIHQTMHTHPTDRIGAVIRGHGWCETPDGMTRLDAGTVFRIPAEGRHRFLTEAGSMDIIAFHPDSDTGPTDEDHPMVNRTIVSGVSARYLDNIRTRDA